MLTTRDYKITEEFRRRLTAIVPILDLRVFGSRARGEADPDSDLDIFIKVDSCTPEQRRQINEVAWEVGFEMDRIISTMVATSEQLDYGPLGASPLILNIEQEGICV